MVQHNNFMIFMDIINYIISIMLIKLHKLSNHCVQFLLFFILLEDMILVIQLMEHSTIKITLHLVHFMNLDYCIMLKIFMQLF